MFDQRGIFTHSQERMYYECKLQKGFKFAAMEMRDELHENKLLEGCWSIVFMHFKGVSAILEMRDNHYEVLDMQNDNEWEKILYK